MRTTRRWSVIAFLAVATVIATMFGASSALADPYDPGKPCTIAVSDTAPQQGSSLTVTGTNFTENSDVTIELHSKAVTLATTTTDGVGNFSVQVTIPADTTPGAHEIVATDASGTSRTANITVEAAGASSSPTGSGSSSGGGLASTGVAVISIGSIGVVLLIGGALMLLASRRRNGTHA